MGSKKRPRRKQGAVRAKEICVGCTKEIDEDDDDVIEVRVGKLIARPRRAKFQAKRRWGLMHESCFKMTMGLSEI